jgi:hypothetical protein
MIVDMACFLPVLDYIQSRTLLFAPAHLLNLLLHQLQFCIAGDSTPTGPASIDLRK